jgi:hypothetical protein
VTKRGAPRTPLNPWYTRFPRAVSGKCWIKRCSPWSAPFSPQAPLKIALLCSSGSSILWRGPTPPERARPPCGFGPSRTGLVPLRAEALQRSPGSRACCFSACAGSKTTQDRLLAREYREAAVVPSPNQERVGVLVLRFSKLNSPAHRYPCLRFERHLTMPPARLRAKMESLSPFL